MRGIANQNRQALLLKAARRRFEHQRTVGHAAQQVMAVGYLDCDWFGAGRLRLQHGTRDAALGRVDDMNGNGGRCGVRHQCHPACKVGASLAEKRLRFHPCRLARHSSALGRLVNGSFQGCRFTDCPFGRERASPRRAFARAISSSRRALRQATGPTRSASGVLRHWPTAEPPGSPRPLRSDRDARSWRHSATRSREPRSRKVRRLRS